MHVEGNCIKDISEEIFVDLYASNECLKQGFSTFQ